MVCIRIWIQNTRVYQQSLHNIGTGHNKKNNKNNLFGDNIQNIVIRVILIVFIIRYNTGKKN